MKKQIVEKIDKLPKAVGPYSSAVRSGEYIFLSGQIPINPETNQLIESDIEKQTHQVLTNIKNFLLDNGFDTSDVIKTTVFIKNMDHFPKINEIYSTYFNSPYPARSLVEVSRLPKDVMIEIECIISGSFK